jgi:hypothetical protein
MTFGEGKKKNKTNFKKFTIECPKGYMPVCKKIRLKKKVQKLIKQLPKQEGDELMKIYQKEIKEAREARDARFKTERKLAETQKLISEQSEKKYKNFKKELKALSRHVNEKDQGKEQNLAITHFKKYVKNAKKALTGNDKEELTEFLKKFDKKGFPIREVSAGSSEVEEEQKGDGLEGRGLYDKEFIRKKSELENQIENTNNQIRELEEKRIQILSPSNAVILFPTTTGREKKRDAQIMHEEYTIQIKAKEDILKKLKKDLDILKNTTKYGTFSFTNQEEEQKGDGSADRTRGSAPLDDGVERRGEGLYDYQIDDIMEDYPCYKGTWADDEVHQIPISNKMCWIGNTDVSKGPGKHWYAVHIDDHDCMYYDPFGEPPSDRFMKQLKNLVEKINPKRYLKLKINSVKNQDISSDNCGWHCISFLNKIYNGRDFKTATGYKEPRIDNSEEFEKQAEKLKKQNGFGLI